MITRSAAAELGECVVAVLVVGGPPGSGASGGVGVVVRLFLTGRDEADLAVHTAVVVPVDVLGDGDLEVVDPSRCRQRKDGGLVLAELKTKQSRRTLPLPEPLLVALRQHRHRQREARIRAGTLWDDYGFVFTTVTGRPVAPRDHSLHWTAFLEGLGIRPARLHDARHTAATLLLVQGVDQRVVMSMFGWTSPAMTTRYQHVVPELVEEANRRMGELLWGGGRSSLP